MTLTERAIDRLNRQIDEYADSRDRLRCRGNTIWAECVEALRRCAIARRDRLELRLCRDE